MFFDSPGGNRKLTIDPIFLEQLVACKKKIGIVAKSLKQDLGNVNPSNVSVSVTVQRLGSGTRGGCGIYLLTKT